MNISTSMHMMSMKPLMFRLVAILLGGIGLASIPTIALADTFSVVVPHSVKAGETITVRWGYVNARGKLGKTNQKEYAQEKLEVVYRTNPSQQVRIVTLALRTPNDGSETVRIPALPIAANTITIRITAVDKNNTILHTIRTHSPVIRLTGVPTITPVPTVTPKTTATPTPRITPTPTPVREIPSVVTIHSIEPSSFSLNQTKTIRVRGTGFWGRNIVNVTGPTTKTFSAFLLPTYFPWVIPKNSLPPGTYTVTVTNSRDITSAGKTITVTAH